MLRESSLREWRVSLLALAHDEVDHALERIEAEGLRHRRPQVGIRVNVVEHQPAVARFQVFDAAAVELPGGTVPLPHATRLRRTTGFRLKPNRRRALGHLDS